MPLPATVENRFLGRAPEIIQVRIGRKNETGIPQMLDYFTFYRMDSGREICEDRALAQLFSPDGKPTSIRVRLVFDSLEANMRSGLAAYDSRRAFCHNREGNNTAKRRVESGGYEPIECDPDTCPVYLAAQPASAAAGKKSIIEQAIGAGIVKNPASLSCKLQVIFRFALRGPDDAEITSPGQIATFRTTSGRMYGNLRAAIENALRYATALHDLLVRADKGLAETITLADVVAQLPHRMILSAERTPFRVMQFVSLVPAYSSEAIASLIMERAKGMTLALSGLRDLPALLPGQIEVEDSEEAETAFAEEFHPAERVGVIEVARQNDLANKPMSLSLKKTEQEPAVDLGENPLNPPGDGSAQDRNAVPFEDDVPPPEDHAQKLLGFDDDLDERGIAQPVKPEQTKYEPSSDAKPLDDFVERAGTNNRTLIYNQACKSWPHFWALMVQCGLPQDEMPIANITSAKQVEAWLKGLGGTAIQYIADAIGGTE